VETWDKTLREVAKESEYLAQAQKAGYLPFYHNAKEMQDFLAKESEEVANLYEVKKK
jgi:tripartite-type tricarboxylate transporter receptor subunit TctC